MSEYFRIYKYGNMGYENLKKHATREQANKVAGKRSYLVIRHDNEGDYDEPYTIQVAGLKVVDKELKIEQAQKVLKSDDYIEIPTYDWKEEREDGFNR